MADKSEPGAPVVGQPQNKPYSLPRFALAHRDFDMAPPIKAAWLLCVPGTWGMQRRGDTLFLDMGKHQSLSIVFEFADAFPRGERFFEWSMKRQWQHWMGGAPYRCSDDYAVRELSPSEARDVMIWLSAQHVAHENHAKRQPEPEVAEPQELAERERKKQFAREFMEWYDRTHSQPVMVMPAGDPARADYEGPLVIECIPRAD
jgi:hypothetical protein